MQLCFMVCRVQLKASVNDIKKKFIDIERPQDEQKKVQQMEQYDDQKLIEFRTQFEESESQHRCITILKFK